MKIQKTYSHMSGNGGRRNNNNNGGGGGGKKSGNSLNYIENYDRRCNWCGKVIVLAALEKPTVCPHCNEQLPLTLTSGSFTRCPRCWLITNTMWKYCDCGRFNPQAIGKHSRAKPDNACAKKATGGSSLTSSSSSSSSSTSLPPVSPATGPSNVGPCRPMTGDPSNVAIVAMVRQLREEFASAYTQRLELQRRMEEVDSESQGLLEQQVVLVGEREALEEERRKLAMDAQMLQQQRLQLEEERRVAQQLASNEIFNNAVAHLNIGDNMEEEGEEEIDINKNNEEEEERILNSTD